MKTKEQVKKFEYKHVEVFTIIKPEKSKKFKICLGNNIVSTADFETIEDAEKYIQEKPYELIINTCCTFYSLISKSKNNE